MDQHLQSWAAQQQSTPIFLTQSRYDGLNHFLRDVPVPLIALRATQKLSFDPPMDFQPLPGERTRYEMLEDLLGQKRRIGPERPIFGGEQETPFIPNDKTLNSFLGIPEPGQDCEPENIQEGPELAGPVQEEDNWRDDWPAVLADLAVGMIPVYGNYYAAVEVFSGYNMVLKELGPIERAALLVGILVPWVVKGAKIAITLTKAGYKAMIISSSGSKALSAASVGAAKAVKAEAAAAKLASIGAVAAAPAIAAAEVVLKGKPISLSLRLSVSRLMTALVKSSPRLAGAMLPRAQEALMRLVRRWPLLQVLDEAALQRVASAKGVDLVKGTLFEELCWARLSSRFFGRFSPQALGIPPGLLKVGEHLEGIPGHLLKDINGRQITDGMIGVRKAFATVVTRATEKGSINIAGRLKVFVNLEFKSGEASFKSLAGYAGRFSKLKGAAKQAIYALAQKEHEAEQIFAATNKLPYTKTLDEVAEAVYKRFSTGQVSKDFLRLIPDYAGNLAIIAENGVAWEVELVPQITQFWGIVRTGMDYKLLASVERSVRAEGFHFFVDRMVPVTAQELATMSEEIAYWAKVFL